MCYSSIIVLHDVRAGGGNNVKLFARRDIEDLGHLPLTTGVDLLVTV